LLKINKNQLEKVLMSKKRKQMEGLEEMWECSQCTFHNHISLVHCEMCQFSNENYINLMEESNSKVIDLSSPSPSSSSHDKDDDVHNNNQMDTNFHDPLSTLIIQAAQIDQISMILCSIPPQHFTQKGGYGSQWSCGYRNIQMIISALLKHPDYHTTILKGKSTVPTIYEIQESIEQAWKDGFDQEVSTCEYLMCIEINLIH
jgi:hypothetical protein